MKQPACRNDDDWMRTQADYLGQIKSLACTVRELWLGNRNTTSRPIPVLCAGDIFDKWNASPELIHFALEHLPDGMICVPGQHDLPNHRMEEMSRSGYGVLAKAGKIKCASSHRRAEVPTRSHIQTGYDGTLFIYGFGWNEEITPPPLQFDYDRVHPIALVHHYIWDTGSNSFPGAKMEDHFNSFKKSLDRYSVAVFGDNHCSFDATLKPTTPLKRGTHIFNCGGFIRRKVDEVDRKPRVGILYENGTVRSHLLDTRADKFLRPEEIKDQMLDVNMEQFVRELDKMAEVGLDFRQTVIRGIDGMNLPAPVRSMVLKCLE